MSDEPVVEEVKPRVLVLIATIPARRRSCERLLAELVKQNKRADGVILVLDGYGQAPAPISPLPVIAEYRTPELTGAGARWRVMADLPPEDIVICLDDDIITFEAIGLVKALVKEVEGGNCASAAMGRGMDYKPAPPGPRGRGDLLHAAGCGLTVRAKHLIGLREFANEILAAGGPDTLGVLGDDDAVVSAFLWKQKIKVKHAGTGNIYPAPGTRSTSQTAARAAKRQSGDIQKAAIARITGWPWLATPPRSKVIGPGVRR